MQKFYSIFISLFFVSNIFSQTISGFVVEDELTKVGISNTVVYVTKKGSEKIITSSKSNDDGKFSLKFEAEAGAEYLVHGKYLGYETFVKEVNASSFPLKMNITLIKKNATQLNEVEINAIRSRATVKDDTVIYDAKAFKTHKDANVEDLVTKMPGITKEGGEVKAYGEKVQKVLVDGQEFFGEDANIALKNLPAETVDKVEIYDAMNDRNSFTGFNDGNTSKTINLKTKAGKNKGQFGKAYAGYGTNDRAQMGGNFNYYNGSKRISMLGMANNINNLNFSTSELVGAMTGSSNMGGAQGAGMMRGMSFGMSVSGAGKRGGFGGPMSNFTVSNQDGVNNAYSFGLNYNDIWGVNKKLRTTMSYFGNRTDNFTQSEMTKRNLINTANTLNTDQSDISNSESYKHRFSTRMDGELDAKNSFVWTNKLNFTDNNSTDKSNMNNFFTEGVSVLNNINNSNSLSFTTDFNTNFLYKLKLNKTGRTFSVNTILDVNSNNGTSGQNTITTRSGVESNFGLDYLTKQWTSTVTNILTYTEPSGKYGQWLVNYSPSLSNRKNDRLVSMYNSLNPTPLEADSLSSKFTNNLFYNTGGISYRLQYTKWRIMFGSNIQNINFNGNQTYPGTSELKKDFFGVLPYFNVQFSPQKMTKLRLTYNTSMNVPSVSQIQPVLDLSNPTSVYKGNENLNSDYSHNLFFHYMKPDIVKGTFFIIVSNLNLTNNKISNYSYTTINDTTLDNIALRKGMTYNKYVNMDNAFNGFLFANYTMPVKFLKSNLSMNGNYSYNQTPSMINLQENMTKTNMYSVGVMLTSNVSENVDFTLSYNPKYFSNTFSIAGLGENNYWTHTAGTTMKLTLLKDFVWSYDFSYNYNSQIDPTLNQHVLLLGSSLAYKMLKNKQLEAKLTVFDIFNQNQNISRNISNTSITDSRVNAMNRYGMFTLTYNFKKFEGRDPDKNSSGFMKMMTPQ